MLKSRVVYTVIAAHCNRVGVSVGHTGPHAFVRPQHGVVAQVVKGMRVNRTVVRHGDRHFICSSGHCTSLNSECLSLSVGYVLVQDVSEQVNAFAVRR